MTDHDFVLSAVRQVNPRPAGSTGPDAEWSTSELLLQIEQRSGTMQTVERKTETKPSPGLSRRRGLLVAAAALVVAIIAAGVVIGLLGGSSDEPDVGGLQPGPVSSFEDIAGITYERQGPGSEWYFHFFADGTKFHVSQNPDLVVDRPQEVHETRLEGTEVSTTTTSARCDQPDQVGTYEIHVLQNGHLQFVVIEDPCEGRSGIFNAEWAPVP